MNKKGISAVVATVLVILITVVVVGVIWIAIIPMISERMGFDALGGCVSVVLTGGYTLYDVDREIATVQIKRDVDDGVMNRIKVLFVIEGNSVSSNVVAPGSGQSKTYSFDLSGLGVPESVGVAPIFISGNSEKEGSVSSVKIPVNAIERVRGNVYEMGRDYFSEVSVGGLVSMWTFSGDVLDGWRENDGKLIGGVIVEDNIRGKVLDLDGINDYAEIVSAGDLDMSAGDFSFSLWLKIGSSSMGSVFCKGGVNQGGKRYYLSGINTGGIKVEVDDDNVKVNIYSSMSLNDSAWHHIVGMRDGNNLRMYIDGSEELTSPADVSVIGDINSPRSLYLGACYDEQYTNDVADYFNGSIDDIIIFDRALSPEEVTIIYDIQLRQ